MRHYITFEKAELNSTITTLGYNLRGIAKSIIHFQQYARLQGAEHDVVIDAAISSINKTIESLKYEFNLPIENNACLESISPEEIEETVKRVNKDHDNPYRATIPKLKELVRSFHAIAESEGRDTNWDDIKMKCKRIL